MDVKAYVLSMVSAALVCSLISILLGNKNGVGRIAILLGGVLMAVTALSPLRSISFAGIMDNLDELSFTAETYVNAGTALAQNSIAEIIKAQSEAYILDKANRMGLDIAVEVELDAGSGNIPCGAVVTGDLSPYAKEVLSSYMVDTLGIAKEKQRWN